jgi:hypothetical protein
VVKVFLAFLVAFLIPVNALSQDRAIVKNNNKYGYWFSEEIGDRILADLERYKLQKELNFQLELKIEKQQEKINLLEQKIDIDEQIIENHKSIIKEQNVIILKIEDENEKLRKYNDKWYNKKGFWFISGFVLSSIAAISISVSLR